LFIQIIDFLKIRRRPEPERYLGEFLALTTNTALGTRYREIRSALIAMSETACVTYSRTPSSTRSCTASASW
jgi:hypothetical protein